MPTSHSVGPPTFASQISTVSPPALPPASVVVVVPPDVLPPDVSPPDAVPEEPFEQPTNSVRAKNVANNFFCAY